MAIPIASLFFRYCSLKQSVFNVCVQDPGGTWGGGYRKSMLPYARCRATESIAATLSHITVERVTKVVIVQEVQYSDFPYPLS